MKQFSLQTEKCNLSDTGKRMFDMWGISWVILIGTWKKYWFFCRYDLETMYFDEGVRTAKRKQLESSMLDVSNSFPNDQLHHWFEDLVYPSS